VKFEEHVTAGLNHITQTGNIKLMYLHNIWEKKVLQIGKP